MADGEECRAGRGSLPGNAVEMEIKVKPSVHGAGPTCPPWGRGRDIRNEISMRSETAPSGSLPFHPANATPLSFAPAAT